jgi:hypothetical protein
MVRDILLWGVALSVICSSTTCRREPPASAPDTARTAETDATAAARRPAGADLQVTPLGAGHNEIAEILSLEMWRFHVVCAAPGALILHTISLRKNGQWVKEISGGLSRWPDRGGDQQMIVALYPLDGDLNTSDRLKTYVRLGGTKFSSIRDNPLKGRHGITTLSVAGRQQDGSFLLMQSSESGGRNAGENNMQLVLKISMSKLEGTPPPH